MHKAVPGRPLRSLLRYNRPYWRRYLLGAFLAAVFVTASLVIPLVVRAFIDAFEADGVDKGLLWTYFWGLVGAALVTDLARYFERTLIIGASRRFEFDLRNDYFAHVQRLSQSFFHRTSTGDIMARATNDMNYVRDLIGPALMGTVDMVRIPFTLGVMAYLSTQLTGLALVPLPFLSLAVYLLVRYMHRQSAVVQQLFADLSAMCQENLAGARVVRAYGIGAEETARFTRLSERYRRENVKLVAVMAMAWPLIGLLIGGTVLIVIWQGGKMVIHNALALGDLTAFLICMVMLAFPLAQFGWVVTLYQRGMVGMRRILNILGEQPDIRDGAHTDPDAAVPRGAIEFRHVGFAYPHEPPANVLDEVSFTVAPGETIAIVGPTGAGKSTIAALLAREYDVCSGEIRVDGADIRRIPLKTLRKSLACVPQDAFLFSDTVRNNVTFGQPDASEERIRWALDTAQFTGVLEDLPDGLETLLGERGINLSGGQKQRLTIARAVLCPAPILLLDDALSSVDTHTEERILQGLRRVMAQRSCILIAHRISTVRDAGRILVLDAGRVAEQGTHDELLALDGRYAAMHRRQLLEAALEEEAGEGGRSP